MAIVEHRRNEWSGKSAGGNPISDTGRFDIVFDIQKKIGICF
jgi:hypothetical protein